MRTTLTTIATVGALLVPTGSAMAQSTPSSTGYRSTPVPIPQSQVLGEVGEVQNSKAPATQQPQQQTAPEAAQVAQPTPAVKQSGSLPFTGMDIGIVAALGVALLAAGVMMRRSTSSDRA